MYRKILIAGAAIAALSIAACGKPADKAEETTVTDTTTVTEPMPEAGAVDGGGSVGNGAAAAADTGGGSGIGGVTASDTGAAPAVGAGAPTVDTSQGAATATTPTARVPLETERKNNPPPSQ